MRKDLRVAVCGAHPVLTEHLKSMGIPQVLYTKGPIPDNHAVYFWTSPEGFLGQFLKKTVSAVVFVPESLRDRVRDLARIVHFYPDRFLSPETGALLQGFRFGDVLACETVARASKKGARQTLLRQLQDAYARQNLYLPRLGLYPRGFSTIFSFRVDADEYEAEAFGRFFRTARRYAPAISLFVCASTYEKAKKECLDCRDAGFDLHSHGFVHYTYRSKAQNVFNLKKANAFLGQLGIHPKGFAAPHGRWNAGLQEALEEIGFEFSSDFSYNYDDIPDYPILRGRRSGVLQIPIHPVGLGVYMEAACHYKAQTVEAYFGTLFQRKKNNGEPVFFYDHPTRWLGEHPEFMDFLFRAAFADKRVWVASMSQWADWWKQRDRVSLSIAQECGESVVELEAVGDEGRFLEAGTVVFRDAHGREAQINPQAARGVYDLKEVVWQSPPEVETDPVPVRIREKNPLVISKKAVKHWLDWEKATPTQDLIGEDAPSRAKILLRHLVG